MLNPWTMQVPKESAKLIITQLHSILPHTLYTYSLKLEEVYVIFHPQ